jgi:outer membrane immunogenic protein
MSCKASMACAGAFAAAATLAGTAFAAEPPPAPPPVPVFTWTGVYIGGQIGGAWGGDNFFYTGFDPLTGLAFNPSAFVSPSGVIGGAHVGANYQIDKPGAGFVLGLEGSVDGTSLHSTGAASLGALGGGSVSASTNTDIQGSIRGRFGIAWDRLLLYGTGGVAFGGFNTSYSTTGNNGGAPFFASNSFSNTRTGWTAGGGLDYAITNNWSVFAEYRYTSFGTVENNGLAATAFATVPRLTGGVLNSTRTLNQNQVQVGFSYKFDINAPNPEWFSMF